mmetsp:Transcript_16187/g.28715  ORF Transcript_16187/g.28715 Transcript_16187/m.28715 type:complete len:422 (+) Transcript_16187:151-1416(+)
MFSTKLSRAEEEKWDQRLTLRPPPYRKEMARLAAGLEVGDPLFDELPVGKLACHGKDAGDVPQAIEPEWADWGRIQRGQQLWQDHLSRAFTGLSLGLLLGFSIARFAEVLFLNGYAQDGWTAQKRYSATSFAISDWYRFNLKDPKSPSRQSIYTVRAMHAFARRRSRKLFDKEKGEGIPLSQYDMAEVQLGFSGVVMLIIEHELGFGVIPENDARDMVFFWRYVGYHLGIMDEYNCCNDLDDLRRMTEEYRVWTPRRIETMRSCSEELQRTAIEGFGYQTGLGKAFWYGALDTMFSSKLIELSHLRPAQKFPPGVEVLAGKLLKSLSKPYVAKRVSMHIVEERDFALHDPDGMTRKIRHMSRVSRFFDAIMWRFYGLVYYLRNYLGIFAIAALVQAALPKLLALKHHFFLQARRIKPLPPR